MFRCTRIVHQSPNQLASDVYTLSCDHSKILSKFWLSCVSHLTGLHIRRVVLIQMEYCENTLRYLIDHTELWKDEQRCWRLFRQMLEGVDFIHSKGIIHRSVTEQNGYKPLSHASARAHVLATCLSLHHVLRVIKTGPVCRSDHSRSECECTPHTLHAFGLPHATEQGKNMLCVLHHSLTSMMGTLEGVLSPPDREKPEQGEDVALLLTRS